MRASTLCRALGRMLISRMFSVRRLLIATAAILFAQSALAQNYQGKELVHATLLADTSAVVPGKPFHAGVLLRMAPAWHTYWKYSGDAGLPTEIKWNLPPGWKVGEIQWPIPLKTIDPGDIQTYGYQDEVMLIQEITPPAKIDNSPVKLSAQVDWLVCERLCIPGNANLALELPVGSTAGPKNTDLFARYRRLVPHNFPDPKIASADWSRNGNDLLLKITSDQIANHQSFDFFPVPQGNDTVSVIRASNRAKPTRSLLRFQSNRRIKTCHPCQDSLFLPSTRTATIDRLGRLARHKSRRWRTTCRSLRADSPHFCSLDLSVDSF